MLEQTAIKAPQLTQSELRIVLRRRSQNLNLPDDLHTSLAETVTTCQTLLAAFAIKLHLLRTRRSADFKQNHPRITTFLRILCLSQLRPFRIMLRPLLHVVRPLSWFLAPAYGMALPALVDVVMDTTVAFLRSNVPAPKTPQQAAQDLSESVTSMLDMLHSKLRTGKSRLDEFLSQKHAELTQFREEIEAKLNSHNPGLHGPPAFRIEDVGGPMAATPPVGGNDLTIRTPIKGLDFRAPRGFQELSADTPRRHLTVPTPAIPLLPRSIARTFDGASPPSENT